MNKNKNRDWERSPTHANVIIVNTWRKNKMNEDNKKAEDEKIVKKLLPAWRQFLLASHAAVTSVGAFIWTPVTWVSEQLNGTADMRATLQKMKDQEKKDKQQAA